MTGDCQLIGRIVRLQVQTANLKRGDRPRSWYDPAPITAVPHLMLNASGVRGVLDDGTMLDDVHNESHPTSKFRGENGISIGFTSHYEAMRDRFGDILIDGIAGENILVASDATHSIDSLGPCLLVESGHGDVWLAQIEVATPCVEFSKFCLGFARDQKPDRTVTSALQFLHNGIRGFYATAPHAGILRTGDPVYRAVRPAAPGGCTSSSAVTR